MATLVRWAPFRDLDLERDMRRLFDGFGFAPAMVPAADLYETKDEFVFEVEVPGYAEQELGIEVTDHTLIVKGERKTVQAEEEKTYRLHERLETEFERRFELPPQADTKKLSAVFEHGVLEVHAPKAKEPVAKKIPIGKS